MVDTGVSSSEAVSVSVFAAVLEDVLLTGFIMLLAGFRFKISNRLFWFRSYFVSPSSGKERKDFASKINQLKKERRKVRPFARKEGKRGLSKKCRRLLLSSWFQEVSTEGVADPRTTWAWACLSRVKPALKV